jgi:hypothetical protein
MAGIKHRKVGQANHCLGSDGRAHNLWFWHHSFGWPGSLNDINVWNRSCLLKSFLDGSLARDVEFELTTGDNKVFNCLWILVDDIYSDLSKPCRNLSGGERAGTLSGENLRARISSEPLEFYNVNSMCLSEKLINGM